MASNHSISSQPSNYTFYASQQQEASVPSYKDSDASSINKVSFESRLPEIITKDHIYQTPKKDNNRYELKH